MTSEPPPRPARRTRPDSAFRSRALGLDAPSPVSADPAGGVAASAAPRESLRQALARIPNLDREETEVLEPAVPETSAPEPAVPEPEPEPEPVPPVPEPAPAVILPSSTSINDAAEVIAKASFAPPTGRRGRPHPSPPPTPPWWRRVAFGLTLVLLVASIPLLGRTGYRLVTESTDGRDGDNGAGPTDPGYEELVTSTPTALVVQKDAEGLPVALTFLSLSNGDEGGSVIFIPLDTAVTEPGFGVDRLRTSYTAVADDPVGATNQIAAQTAKVLNVGIDEVIVLDDRGWSQLVAPVAPIPFDNPEPIDLASGTVPSGQVSLAADQFGPFLAARRDGETESAALYRQEVAWTAWLAAVAASDRPDSVPGETATGMGRFARTLAAGAVTYDDLPGEFSTPIDGGVPRFEPDEGAVSDLVVDAVPAPDAPFPGARTTVRVLNGVGPGDIPLDVVRTVSSLNGSVTVVGNGPSFDNDETTIVYGDPARKDYALLLQAALGAEGEVRLDRTASDAVEVTVVLGRDVLGDGPQTRASSSTSTVLGGVAGAGSSTNGSTTTTSTTTTQPLGGM